ncbi:MAG TPA: VTT domain-containing protein [Pyrinomonadaceae bacterium]|nr:VTT domain-containing protein [Pyrinomonadaceae bacterium]
MNWLKKIGARLEEFSAYLQTFGPAGLFAIAFLDSALIPLPGGPDAVMLLLSAREPAMMPVFALTATVGSVAGCLVLYYISRRAGRRALEKFPPEKQARVKAMVDRYDVLSVLVASVLPPPFPFKLFVVTAGVFRLSVVRFALAVAVGRAFRFFLEGYFAVRYGDRAKDLLAEHYPTVGLSVAGLIVVVFVARSLWRRRGSGRAAPEEGGPGAG